MEVVRIDDKDVTITLKAKEYEHLKGLVEENNKLKEGIKKEVAKNNYRIRIDINTFRGGYNYHHDETLKQFDVNRDWENDHSKFKVIATAINEYVIKNVIEYNSDDINQRVNDKRSKFISYKNELIRRINTKINRIPNFLRKWYSIKLIEEITRE